jgi:hypothetical protein
MTLKSGNQVKKSGHHEGQKKKFHRWLEEIKKHPLLSPLTILGRHFFDRLLRAAPHKGSEAGFFQSLEEDNFGFGHSFDRHHVAHGTMWHLR